MLDTRARTFGRKSVEGFSKSRHLQQLKLLPEGIALHARNFRTKKCIYINDFSTD